MSDFALISKTSIGRKLVMALTGLFLCLFLVGHLAGNLQLLFPGEDARRMFNEYALFMTTNPAVKALSWVTYLSILFHILDGLIITLRNKKARPVNYAANAGSANSSWASRNMAVLGTTIAVFLVIHLRSFWFEMHWGSIGNDPWGNRDLHSVVVAAFSQWWYVLIYVLAMAAIGFHLVHGFWSGFQTLGLATSKYGPLFKKAGTAFAILIPALFALIPVVILITSLS